jgi:ATP-dependent DNA ligase
MLATVQSLDDIKQTVYVSYKYDGIRAILYDGKVYSRTGKLIEGVDLTKARDLLGFIRAHGHAFSDNIFIDGELILRGTRGETRHFNDLSGKARGPVSQRFDLVEFFPYDFGGSNLLAQTRIEIFINKWAEQTLGYELHTAAHSADEINKLYRAALDDGYEGVMLRTHSGLYEEGKRSKELIKLKPSQTEEFTIIGVIEGKGKLEGCVGAFAVRGDEGISFTVKLADTEDNLRELFKVKETLISKQLTVKFNGKSEYGVPRFPVGLAIRDYE